MKFPPYTYKEEFLFAKHGSQEGERVVSVGARTADGFSHGLYKSTPQEGSWR